MKISRQLLREMILTELQEAQGESPAEVAQALIAQHSLDFLSAMTEAEVENLAYTLMSEMGVMDDDWPNFLDDVLEALAAEGAGQGESVMGVHTSLGEAFDFLSFSSDETNPPVR